MRQIRFGCTEETVSAIAIGTWAHGGAKSVGRRSVGWSGHDDDKAQLALVAAYEAGINHWDTADVYGDGRAERLIGAVWDRVSRDEIFLATKVGWDPGPYEHAYDPRRIQERLERSLKLLATDQVDLFYLHHCDFGADDRYLEGAISTLESLRAAGKICFLGLSDWSARKLVRIARLMQPDVVQVYRNVLDDDYAPSGLKVWVEERDAGVAFFSPLKHGLLLGKYDTPVDFSKGDMRREIPAFRDPELLARIRHAVAEIESRFPGTRNPALHALAGVLLSDSPTASILVGQRNPEQAAEAASVGEPLSDEDAEWVRRLYSGVD